MKDIEHPDTELVADIASGFRITWSLPPTAVFTPKRPEDVKVGNRREWLWERAHAVREALMTSPRPSSPKGTAIDREVLGKTLGKVEKGWATGPLHL